MFHYTRFLLRCAGFYLLGSDVDDVLIENEVFGKKVLHSVLNGTHNMRSLQTLCIVSERLSACEWESFWLAHDPHSMDSVVQLAISTKESFMRKKERRYSGFGQIYCSQGLC